MVHSLKSLFFMLAALFLTMSCGQSVETRKENWYSSASWSPEGDQVAYFRRYIEYTHASGRISWFIGEETVTNLVQKEMLYLCVNTLSGDAERIITEINYQIDQTDTSSIPQIYTAILWESENTLYYGAGNRTAFSTGVHVANPVSGRDEIVEGGFDAVAALGQRRIRTYGELELYSNAEGSYGFLGNQTIYIFDHSKRKVIVYLHDSLSKKKPYIPPYSVTGK